MPKRTYYEVLDLDQQAPAAQIKSHYRRLAKRYHPDLNPSNPHAAQQFLEIQTAYDTLSDPEKRQHYDQTVLGHDHAAQAGFTRAYRRYDGRSRPRPRSRPNTRPVSRPHRPRSAYSQYSVEVSIQELFRGTRRSLVVGHTFTCGRCRGRGKLESEVSCPRCGGYGFVVSYQRVEVVIPPGLQPDMTIRLALNDDNPEHPLLDAPVMSNVCITVRLAQSHPFEYRDHQLHTTTEVPVQVLTEGGNWTIPGPEGGEITFKIPANTASGSTLTLRKHGLRNGTSQRRGNLFCTVVTQEAKAG